MRLVFCDEFINLVEDGLHAAEQFPSFRWSGADLKSVRQRLKSLSEAL